MSNDIKPGQVWAWGYRTDDPFTIESLDGDMVRYHYGVGSVNRSSYAAPARVIQDEATLVPLDTTPAPLDPSKVKAGDTVTLSADETSTRGPVKEIQYAGGGEWDIWIANHAHPFRAGRIGLWAVTDHQPAVEPEPGWKPGTVAVVIQGGDPGAGVDDHEFPAALQTDGTWVGLAGEAATAAPVSVRPLVVIDPAGVDVHMLRDVYANEAHVAADSQGIYAVLTMLGIEVAR